MHPNPSAAWSNRPVQRYAYNWIDDVPKQLELRQNYPNPFNPTTTIQFDLPQQSFVTLKVYNLLGQEIATLLNRDLMDDGTQEIEFNAANVPSGVYFYRIVSEALPAGDSPDLPGKISTITRKMVLLK
jgi:hypothetical protein